MKKFALVPLALFASHVMAGANTGTTGTVNIIINRVPEPEMWALIGLAAAAIGAARLLKKKSRK